MHRLAIVEVGLVLYIWQFCTATIACCPMPPKLLQFCIFVFCISTFLYFLFACIFWLVLHNRQFCTSTTGFCQIRALSISANTTKVATVLCFCIFVFLYFWIFLLILYSTMLVFNGSSIYRCHRHQSCHLCSQKRPPPLNRSGDKMDYRSFIRALKFQNRTRPSADGLLCCRPKLFLASRPPVG